MAFDIYNEHGFTNAGPSIGGLRDLKRSLIDVNSAKYPQMASLLTYGFATSPIRLKLEAMALSRVVQKSDVKSTLLAISRAAAKSQDIVILHDHVS